MNTYYLIRCIIFLGYLCVQAFSYINSSLSREMACKSLVMNKTYLIHSLSEMGVIIHIWLLVVWIAGLDFSLFPECGNSYGVLLLWQFLKNNYDDKDCFMSVISLGFQIW